MKDRFGRSTL